jgi:undecaprenyl-diphosphatase
MLSPLDAIILGAVEGVTEFLPISSTGHLLIVQRLLGLGTGSGKSAADTYAIAIQLGAIVAVIGIYRSRIASMFRGVVGRDRAGLRLVKLLAVAFAPSAIVGLAFDDAIKAHLFGVWPVIAAWVVGGVFLLVWRPAPGHLELHQLSFRVAGLIGAAQVLALWPGSSRSLATIAAGLALGVTASAAVEFSFLLGLITLSAATGLDLIKHGGDVKDQFGLATPALGAVVAAITATVAVAWFIGYLRNRPMTVFGWYRLAAATATIALVVTHQI